MQLADIMDTFGWGPSPGGDLGLLGGGEPSLLIDLDDRTLQASAHSWRSNLEGAITTHQAALARRCCCSRLLSLSVTAACAPMLRLLSPPPSLHACIHPAAVPDGRPLCRLWHHL